MCVCVCVYMYTHTHIYIYIYIYIYIHTQTDILTLLKIMKLVHLEYVHLILFYLAANELTDKTKKIFLFKS